MSIYGFKADKCKVPIGTIIHHYDTIAQMKADTKLQANDVVQTLGYYEANDGGEGLYKIVNDNTLVDDGGSVHSLTNGLRAKLIIDRIISYDQFGAKGDGITNDFEKIYNTHVYANQNNLLVRTNPDKFYKIGEADKVIPIKTNVDWNTSNFIIDDTNISNNCKKLNIFECSVTPEKKTLTSLSKNTKYLEGINKNYFVYIMDNNTRMYYRKGFEGDTGKAKRDNFVINKNGIIESTILFDFDNISYNDFFEIQKPLEIKGGIFKTLRAETFADTGYIKRGILIQSSNVTISNLSHEMIDNNQNVYSTYQGFLSLQNCYNIYLNNINLTPHKYTSNESSYELELYCCINVYLNGVKCDNIVDDSLWGVMGCNFIKNIYFNDCKLNRIDCHTQAENLYINNCIIGDKACQLNGFNDLIIENSIFYSNFFVNLREDFGASWNGNIVIKKSRLIPSNFTSLDYIALVRCLNDGTFNFGYECVFPNIELEDVTIDDTKLTIDVGIAILGNTIIASDSLYKPYCKEYIRAKNVISTSLNSITPFLYGNMCLFSKAVSSINGSSTTNDYTKPRLNIITNFTIVLDNITMKTTTTANDMWNIACLRQYIGSEQMLQKVLNDTNNYYVIPNITLKNIDNLIAYPNRMICNINIENSNINYFYNNYNGKCLSFTTFKNCNLDATKITALRNNYVDLVFNTAPDMSLFINCYFAKCSAINDITNYKKAFPIFNNIQLVDHVLTNVLNFECCKIYPELSFTGWLPTNTEGKYNFDIMNTTKSQKYLPLLYGTTAQRPVNPTEGSRYFDTTLNKFLCFTDNAWNG